VNSCNPTPRDRRRLSAKTSRQLRLLRAHGVIKKIPTTHRYPLTAKGLLLVPVAKPLTSKLLTLDYMGRGFVAPSDESGE
jgi:hypothetical protein